MGHTPSGNCGSAHRLKFLLVWLSSLRLEFGLVALEQSAPIPLSPRHMAYLTEKHTGLLLENHDQPLSFSADFFDELRTPHA